MSKSVSEPIIFSPCLTCTIRGGKYDTDLCDKYCDYARTAKRYTQHRSKMKFAFGDKVVLYGDRLGLILFCTQDADGELLYGVYTKDDGDISVYTEESIDRFLAYPDMLDARALELQYNLLHRGNKNELHQQTRSDT